MKKYKYADQNGEHVITEEDIIRDYYPYWKERCLKKGLNEDMLTKERCIEDVVHWAWTV